MNPVTFTANYIADTSIKYRNRNNEIKNKAVSVVELDKNSESDREAMFHAASLWDMPKTQNYAWNIFSAMEREKYPNVENEHFIALTTQRENFEKLDHKKLLGVAMFSELYQDENSIEWFQVRPKYNYDYSKNGRRYSQIGHSMLKYLQDNYKSKPIHVSASTCAVEFYKKHGFEPVDEYEYDLYYFE